MDEYPYTIYHTIMIFHLTDACNTFFYLALIYGYLWDAIICSYSHSDTRV